MPGLVDLWGWLSENYCTRDLYELLEPAINLSRYGFYVQEALANAIRRNYESLRKYNNWVKTFGRLREGGYTRFTELAHILEVIGRRGAREFYEGK